jgi:hypothetical protein
MSNRPHPVRPSRRAAELAYGTGSRLRGQAAAARTAAEMAAIDAAPRVIRPQAARMPLHARLAHYRRAVAPAGDDGQGARQLTGRQVRRVLGKNPPELAPFREAAAALLHARSPRAVQAAQDQLTDAQLAFLTPAFP